MMCTLIKVTVQYMNQVICTLTVSISKCIWINRLCIGNSIQCILILQFCNGVQRSKKSVLLCAIRRVCTRCQWLACFSSIRKGTGSLTINHIGSDGKNGSGWLGITIGMDMFQLVHKCGKQVSCNLIRTIVIISITWELSLNQEICSDTVFITNCFYLCIFNG